MNVTKAVIVIAMVGASIIASNGIASAVSTITGMYDTDQECVDAGHKRYPPGPGGDHFWCQQMPTGKWALEPGTTP